MLPESAFNNSGDLIPGFLTLHVGIQSKLKIFLIFC